MSTAVSCHIVAGASFNVFARSNTFTAIRRNMLAAGIGAFLRVPKHVGTVPDPNH
jgi:hypothetical protein